VDLASSSKTKTKKNDHAYQSFASSSDRLDSESYCAWHVLPCHVSAVSKPFDGVALAGIR
jgi:hypothetical protein